MNRASTTTHYSDTVFAAIDQDLSLERVAGGNETEVYRSDDGRFAIKVKAETAGTLQAVLAEAHAAQRAANRFTACLGVEHTIPSYYLIARDSQRRAQLLVIQPYLSAQPLASIDYQALSRDERRWLARQLLTLIYRSLRFYRATGSLPDLYGRTSANAAERARRRGLAAMPDRVWSFLFHRTLLHSQNLLLTDGPARQLVLVDYDTVRRSLIYRLIYFAMRVVLFVRDALVVVWMARR